MFVDELTIKAKAGNGGHGVVRWRKEKFIDRGGPAGGNGGRGGDVYMRAVKDLNLLSKYSGAKEFKSENGGDGGKQSKDGKNGDDLYIDIPVGAIVTEEDRGRQYSFMEVGVTHKILKGGRGGLGNEYFKSSTNRSPQESTDGKRGENGTFFIELSLIADVGFIGVPNAGKSTLLNMLTRTKSPIGAYPFTTREPYLGELYGYILADIPGLIEDASKGKGLGHKFLRHVQRTKMLLHCVSLTEEDPLATYKMVRNELKNHDATLLTKEEWILLTKTDLVDSNFIEKIRDSFAKSGVGTIYSVSSESKESIKLLKDSIMQHLKKGETV